MRRRAAVVLLGLALGCSSAEAPTTPEGFDHTQVFELFDRDVQVGDTTYPADTVTLFRTEDVLGDLDVVALVASGDTVYAGTPSGLYRLADGRAAFVAVPGAAEPVVDLEVVQGGLLVAHPHRLRLLDADDQQVVLIPVRTATITAAGRAGSQFLAGTGSGLFVLDDAGVVSATVAEGRAVRDIAVAASQFAFVATSTGVVGYQMAQQQITGTWTAPDSLPDDDVRAVMASGNGAAFVAATREGLAEVQVGGAATIVRPVLESGLPNGDLRALDERLGVRVTGHGIGANAFFSGRVEHYHTQRWIPDEEVTAVAVDVRGDRWIGTHHGVARLSTEDTTLSARAETNEGFLQARHWRMDGFVDDSIQVGDEWSLSPVITGDHDNDGLWTEMQIGAWCYAYAVTKEERFYDSARKALDVMFLQVDVPGATFEAAGKKKGFITRSLVRDDEGEVFDSKATQDNWHRQDYGGRTYYWKDDTSADEYAGHYFGIPIFYDLCAKDDAERAEIADYLRLTTDYVMAGDYVLYDLDGEPTLHGHWEDLGIAADGLDACVEVHGIERAADCISSRHGGGWLNSTEILGHLLATWHVTGDPKYYEAYERLFTEARYGDMIAISEDVFTVTKPAFANHSDHELAMLGYITLLRYEPNPERRARYVQSLLDFYEYEREEHNPWQVAVIAASHPGEVDTEGALQTLRDMPIDWRTWRYDNAHREDAGRWPNDRLGHPQFSRVFPYDEIRTMKWNGSPYQIESGSSGRGVLAPTPYLLAYWMLRYHRVLDP
ncbi:MAG: hypothetical protein KC933_11015 [Myxococcales bacterium]|nr:hypothetical protein [Myxococcales bacterium]